MSLRILQVALLLVLAVFPQAVWAQRSPDGNFRIGRVRYPGGGDWYGDPSSLPNLQRALGERLGWKTADRDDVVSFKDDGVFYYPLVYMTGHGNVRFTEEEVRRMRLYLDNGGFLWADDNYGMDTSFRREMKRVYPDVPLVELPFEHGIYKAVYPFAGGLPKIHEHDGGPPHGYGIFRGGRLVVFYSVNTDLGDGLEDPDVHKDPPEKREEALRMAVNIVTYALTH